MGHGDLEQNLDDSVPRRPAHPRRGCLHYMRSILLLLAAHAAPAAAWCGSGRIVPQLLHRTAGISCGTADDVDDIRKKASQVDLGGASDSAAKELEDLEAKMAKRLEAMGAAKVIPPPPPPRERGAFSISNAAAGKEAAAAALAKLRRRETGELEKEHAEQIARALRASQQWLDAKLPVRAKSELDEVKPFMTYTSELGATFFLLYAKVATSNGEKALARRTLLQVSKDASSSSQRWQADQALERSGGASPSSPSAPNEMGNLFQQNPTRWD